MSRSYLLPPREARLCRWLGMLFLIWAALSMAGILSTGPLPGPQVRCADQGCEAALQPVLLLSEEDRRMVQASPDAERAFEAHALRPVVRAGILGSNLLGDGPFAALLLSVGLALRRLAGGGSDALSRALLWLRRASQAAVVWAVARPVGDSLLASLLSGGTPGGAEWRVVIDFADVGTALMLGSAAYAAVWALESGLKAQRDLADFI